MKNSIYFKVGSTIFLITFLSLSCSFFSSKETQSLPSDIVKEYLTLSFENNLEGVRNVTVQNKSFDKSLNQKTEKNIDTNKSNDLQVLPRDGNYENTLPNYPSEVYLAWIRNDFPKLIFNSKLEIKSVEEEIIIENKAKVSVILSNNSIITSSHWVFILERIKDEWKIFDITTESKPISLPEYPENISETD